MADYRFWPIDFFQCDHLHRYIFDCLCPAFIFHEAVTRISNIHKDNVHAAKLEAARRGGGGCCRIATAGCTDCLCAYPLDNAADCFYIAPPIITCCRLADPCGYFGGGDEDDEMMMQQQGFLVLGCLELTALSVLCAVPASGCTRSIVNRQLDGPAACWETGLLCFAWPCMMEQTVAKLRDYDARVDARVEQLHMLSSSSSRNSM